MPIKGLVDLLDSLRSLRDRSPHRFVLDVLGPDGENPTYVGLCKRRVEELGLGDCIRFRGSVNLAHELGELDILVMPSHNEGVPIAILEAMAVGLPVIATDVGGIREVVASELLDIDGATLEPCGIVIAPRDKPGMTDSIEQVIGDVDLFDRFAESSSTRLDRIYNISVTLSQYHSIFTDLGIGGSPRATALAPALAEALAADQGAASSVATVTTDRPTDRDPMTAGDVSSPIEVGARQVPHDRGARRGGMPSAGRTASHRRTLRHPAGRRS